MANQKNPENPREAQRQQNQQSPNERDRQNQQQQGNPQRQPGQERDPQRQQAQGNPQGSRDDDSMVGRDTDGDGKVVKPGHKPGESHGTGKIDQKR